MINNSSNSDKINNNILPKELQEKLEEYRKKRNFQPKDWITKKIKLFNFNTYLRENDLEATVVSVSGDIDSAVILGLLKKAQNLKDSPLKRVLAVNQPIHSST